MISAYPAAADIRLYHLAWEWGLSSAALLTALRAGGFDVSSHFVRVRDEELPALKAALERGQREPEPEPEPQA
ncbi:MAG: hypothetical protein KDD82_03715, partial [Planctomycetes bacterium]|nr:hypothetical protein [Planctomycetota bacterium]